MKWDDWDSLLFHARKVAKEHGEEYRNKLEFENAEIIKQGANEYWIELANSNKKYDTNKNGLVLPFLLQITSVDPIKGEKKLFINGDEQKIMGIEIILENGKTINTSLNSLIKTKNRGFIPAKDLKRTDEFDC